MCAVTLLAFGAFVCFRRLEIYYFTLAVSRPGHLSISFGREFIVWLIAALFIVSGFRLCRFAQNMLSKPSSGN